MNIFIIFLLCLVNLLLKLILQKLDSIYF